VLIRLTLLLAVAATIGAAVALGEPGDPQGPQNDHLTGSGKIAFVDFPSPGDVTVEQIIVSAHSGPAGENPHGQITAHSPLLEEGEKAKAEVSCLRVVGTRAIAGGEFPEPVRYGGVMIRHVNLIVQDNGSDDMATSLAFIDRPRPPGFSPCDVDAPTISHVVQGNYDVNDGTAKQAKIVQ
jgi:hypothetical protein